ncbi:MAG: type IV pilus assembly protein PilM, partial [Gemmatimonadales bacterium]|nr:type IV pilus assembly protein PilM [Gemmatimonadales bacterium]
MRGFGLRRRKTTVGVDIGSGFSKAAVVEHGENEPRLRAFAIAPNEAGTVRGGAIRDPERVADPLSSRFRRERIKSRDVVIGIGGRDVLSKVIEVDRMDEAEARAVMPWEAEQHVPFDMKNVELDFAIIDPNGESSTMTVLLAAAKRDVVETRVALLRRADLKPTTVDVEALALRNAFAANHPTAMKDVTVLVDIGVHSTVLHLLRNGLPLLTRELAIGVPTADDLDECARRIARGIDRTGAFVETGPGIARVYLCGG